MPFDGQQLPEKARSLSLALELLRRDGWCQKMGKTADGKRCMMQAILEIDRKLHKELLFQYTAIDHPLVVWNDTPRRKFAEVEAWFEGQIDKARRERSV